MREQYNHPLRSNRKSLKALAFFSIAFFSSGALAERLSLSGLKSDIDALDARVTDCEKGVDGACRKVANIITVAHEGGDFTSIQAAIDAVPQPIDPATGDPGEVVPTLIKIAPGAYVEQVRLRDNIRLQGAGRNQTLVYPPMFVDSCQSRSAIFCLDDVESVAISDLGVVGFDPVGGGVIEGAISVSDSTNLRMSRLHIADVAYGIVGEAVGHVDIRDNHIPGPADAIVLDVVPGGVVTIAGNTMENGKPTVNSNGPVRIVDNSILGGGLNEWEGILHVSGNRIIGDVFLHPVSNSTFNGNDMLGTLYLETDREVAVVGNQIRGGGFAILDNGSSTIVGNVLTSSGDPISLAPSGHSTIFANQFVGAPGSLPSHNRLVGIHQIRLESLEENVTIQAGDTSIVVDANGGVTVDAASDISFTTSGKFSVDAQTIDLDSSGETQVDAATNLRLRANGTTAVNGTTVRIDAGGTTRIDGSIVDINGGFIRLN